MSGRLGPSPGRSMRADSSDMSGGGGSKVVDSKVVDSKAEGCSGETSGNGWCGKMDLDGPDGAGTPAVSGRIDKTESAAKYGPMGHEESRQERSPVNTMGATAPLSSVTASDSESASKPRPQRQPPSAEQSVVQPAAVSVSASAIAIQTPTPNPSEGASSLWQVVVAKSRVDSFSFDEMVEAIRNAIRGAPPLIALDLRSTRFLSINAIRFLGRTADEIRQAGGELALIAPSEKTKRHFEIYGSLSHFRVFRSAQELKATAGREVARERAATSRDGSAEV